MQVYLYLVVLMVLMVLMWLAMRMVQNNTLHFCVSNTNFNNFSFRQKNHQAIDRHDTFL